MEEAVLAGVSARDLMRVDTEILHLDDPYRSWSTAFNTRRQLFVTDDEGRLRGAVSLHDIKHTLAKPEQPATARDLMVPVRAPQGDRPPAPRRRRPSRSRTSSACRWWEGGRYAASWPSATCSRSTPRKSSAGPPSPPSCRATATRRNSSSCRPTLGAPHRVPRRFAARTLEESAGRRSPAPRPRDPPPPGNGPEERVIPDASTRLEPGDALLLLGPTAAIEALERGEIRQSEAEVHAGID
jgi:hypothetical protein